MTSSEGCQIRHRTLRRANAMRRDQMADFDASVRLAHIMQVSRLVLSDAKKTQA